MLIAVPGSSDLDGVLGTNPAKPDALVRAIRDRFGPFRHRHVLVLTPDQLSAAAREQAHVVVAADPAVRICVLPLRHHALALSLIGRWALAAELRADGWADPGQAVQLVCSMAARSRSLVWHPVLGSLADPPPTPVERMAGLLPGRSYFTEIGAPGLIPARHWPGSGVTDGWFVAGQPPAQLRVGLGAVPLEIDLSPSGYRPYAGRRSVEIAQLASPYVRPLQGPVCRSCSATLVRSQCVFCGCGPVAEREPAAESDVMVGSIEAAGEGVLL